MEINYFLYYFKIKLISSLNEVLSVLYKINYFIVDNNYLYNLKLIKFSK